jgi:hypothetical protein
VLGKIIEPYYARLYIFNYENIAKYSTIIYLDTDILVQHTLAPLLTHSLENKIYAFKEGTINSPDYGQQFFDFTINAENTPGFNSGVLLFPNTSTIHGLFQDCLQHITTHIQEGLPIPACPDQAFLNYHTIKRGLYEDTFINDYIMIYHHKVTFLPEKPTKTILYHFIWPQGNAEHKLKRMQSYMSHVLNHYTHLYPCNSLVKRDIVGKSLYWSNSSITFLQNILSVKDSQGHFIFPPNSVYVYSITSASGDYIGKSGFIKITTDEYKNRKIEVYFTKTYTATATASASATRQSGETIFQSATASATSTVSAEDAYQIALVNASGFASALANASASEPN